MYSDGRNECARTANGWHQYLTFKMPPEKLRAVIEDLMRHPPK